MNLEPSGLRPCTGITSLRPSGERTSPRAFGMLLKLSSVSFNVLLFPDREPEADESLGVVSSRCPPMQKRALRAEGGWQRRQHRMTDIGCGDKHHGHV